LCNWSYFQSPYIDQVLRYREFQPVGVPLRVQSLASSDVIEAEMILPGDRSDAAWTLVIERPSDFVCTVMDREVEYSSADWLEVGKIRRCCRVAIDRAVVDGMDILQSVLHRTALFDRNRSDLLRVTSKRAGLLIADERFAVSWGISRCRDYERLPAEVRVICAPEEWSKVRSFLDFWKDGFKEEPNQALLPTPASVTDRAGARSAPATGAADL
jgi:hypothetical protein